MTPCRILGREIQKHEDSGCVFLFFVRFIIVFLSSPEFLFTADSGSKHVQHSESHFLWVEKERARKRARTQKREK